jgi:hypothetical protein
MVDRPRRDGDWRERLAPLAREAAAQVRRHAPGAAAEIERAGRDLLARAREYRRRRQAEKALAPGKTRLLWLLPLPLLPAAAIALARGDLGGFAGAAAAYAVLAAAGVLARRGMQHEAAVRRQSVLAGRGLPLKLLAWIGAGAGTALAAWAGAGHDAGVALAFGLGAAAGCALLYGLDPRAAVLDLSAAASAAQRETLARAAQQIIAVEDAAARLDHGELSARLRRIAALAHEIVGEMAGDVRDFRRARRFLVSHLDAVERVVSGYAARHQHLRGGELEGNFRRVLVTIEEAFGQQRQRLVDSDLRDLDVQIEVLETQLRHEGLSTTHERHDIP